jgi:hypothetical protein
MSCRAATSVERTLAPGSSSPFRCSLRCLSRKFRGAHGVRVLVSAANQVATQGRGAYVLGVPAR